jgi:hypothetical protein
LSAAAFTVAAFIVEAFIVEAFIVEVGLGFVSGAQVMSESALVTATPPQLPETA